MIANSLSLYLHIPFCERKCGYCDFNSYALEGLVARGAVAGATAHPGGTPSSEPPSSAGAQQNRPYRSGPVAGGSWAEDYAEGLLRELEGRVSSLSLRGRRLATIFFGGGTPSLMPPRLIGRLIQLARENFALEPEAEVTLEANPGTVDRAHFDGFRAAGVNRLSLGVQSLDDGRLALLERIHTAEEARLAVRAARGAGFENLSVDLMFALPGQSAEEFARDLEGALALGTEHLSAYELTLEPGTDFTRRARRGELPALPDEETSLAMYELRDRLLAEAGFEYYEISNFARPGYRCRHNLNYWRRGEYLGLGAGAHSLLGGRRFWNAMRPEDYLRRVRARGHAVAGEERVEGRKALGETLMLGLRLAEGVALEEAERKTGLDVRKTFGEELARLEEAGLVVEERGYLRLTPRGRLLANEVLCQFG
ncbi:MAG: radical SAM family heme chaperone HemW [Nitrospinota bacterium]